MASMTQIRYEAEELGAGRWRYTYEAANIGLWIDGVPAAIQEFTIWFDQALYDSLVIATPDPISNQWDEIVWQPEPALNDAGAYDAFASLSQFRIDVGEAVFGFTVAFDWLGAGRPGRQYYEIIDPVTFETLDAGYTIPEPTTALLLGLGALTAFRKRRA